MKLSKQKCKSCNVWDNYLIHSEIELCIHCNQPINPEAYRLFQERKIHEQKEAERREKAWLRIKPTDSILLVALKRFLYVLELIYLTIVSIIVWLMIWLPG